MKIKLFSVAALIAALFLTSTMSAKTTWTYRDMYTARKACADYYFAIYTAQMDTPDGLVFKEFQRVEDVLSFWYVSRKASADMIAHAAILDTPYTQPTWGIEWDSDIPPGVVFPYVDGQQIPNFGLDFPYPIPGYSTVPPAKIADVSPAKLEATGPTGLVTLYAYNGYLASSQVTPDHYYVPSLGGAPKTLADAKLADWFPTAAQAIANGVPAVVPPPFGETPPTPGTPQVWECQGTVNSDGTLKLDSWRMVFTDINVMSTPAPAKVSFRSNVKSSN